MLIAINPRPEDADARLRPLDLAVEDLLLPVRAGVAARRSATRNHPRAYGGWRDYAERTAALREGLAPRGWRPVEDDGLCLTVHPDGRLALMTALGTAGTGTSEAVTTRRPRGEVTERVVRANAQLELPLGLPERPEARLASRGTPTWVLLVHAEDEEVRSELSLAVAIGDDGHIQRWVDRIPLPVVRTNALLADNPDDDGPAVDFDVPEVP